MPVAARPKRALPKPGTYLVSEGEDGLFCLEGIHKRDGKTLIELENCRNLHRCLLTPKEYLQQHFRELER